MSRPSTTTVPRPEWLPEAVWPHPLASIQVAGTSVHVTDVGPREAPAVLLLTAGMPSLIYRDVIADLSRDHRVVTTDLPGAGLSDVPPDDELTIAAHASTLGAVLHALDLQQVALVPHDLGGPIALRWAAGTSTVASFDPARRHALAVLFRNAAARLDDHRPGEAAITGSLAATPLRYVYGSRNDYLGFSARWRELRPDCEVVAIPGGNHFPMCDDPAAVATTIRALLNDDAATW